MCLIDYNLHTILYDIFNLSTNEKVLSYFLYQYNTNLEKHKELKNF